MSKINEPFKATIIYVIDPPGLILDSIFLLTSIRSTMPDVDVIAYCPENKIASLPPFIVDLHKRLNAEIRPIDANGMFSPDYRHGNKILACAAPRHGDFTIFLDTDIILAKPICLNNFCRTGKISASPEGVMTWGKSSGSWEMIYEMFDLDLPEERVRLVRSGKESLPYFNAGVVAFPNSSNFGSIWLETAQKIDANSEVMNRRPWLDQISLPIASVMANLGFNVLDRLDNFSLSRNQKNKEKEPKVLDSLNEADPTILHYHSPKFFKGTKYEKVANSYISSFTCFSSMDELLDRFKSSTKKLWEVRDEIDVLKKAPNKSQEDIEYLSMLRATRENMKNGTHDPFASWPASIN